MAIRLAAVNSLSWCCANLRKIGSPQRAFPGPVAGRQIAPPAGFVRAGLLADDCHLDCLVALKFLVFPALLSHDAIALIWSSVTP
jgi:hypothetical protein